MEQTRMFVVQSVQRAERTTYDHDPHRPWDQPGAHSLPPAPDKPKARQSRKTLPADNPNMVQTTLGGKIRWGISAEVSAEIERRVRAGERGSAIARALNLSPSTVTRVSKRMSARPQHVRPQEPPAPRTLTPVVVALPDGLSTVARSAIAAARFAFEVPVLPVRITHTVSASTAPRSTMHVLDWERRMAAYAFDGPACPKCKPKKRPKHTSNNGMTRHQLREALGPGKIAKPLAINPACAINCAAPAPARPRSPFD